jgi:UPF0716 protein FxsA
VIGCGLFLAFTVVPIAETWLLIRVGSEVGATETVAYIVGMGMLGAFLGKRAGAGVLAEVQTELRAGRAPTDKLVEGLLVLVGAALMVAPGILTDLVGTLMFVGPVRRWVAPRVRAFLGSRLHVQGIHIGTPRPAGRAGADTPSGRAPRRPAPFDHPVPPE